MFAIQWTYGPIVQWIELPRPKRLMQVRFLLGPPFDSAPAGASLMVVGLSTSGQLAESNDPELVEGPFKIFSLDLPGEARRAKSGSCWDYHSNFPNY